MTAPVHTVRQDPGGRKLEDGFSSVIACAADPDFSIWELEVGGVGVDGGEPVDNSTMHNETWETTAPQRLKKMTPLTGKAGYDPQSFTQGNALINVKTTWTQYWPDGSHVSFFGYLKSLIQDPLVKGRMPTVAYTIIPTLVDPVTGAEEAPVYVDVAGT